MRIVRLYFTNNISIEAVKKVLCVFSARNYTILLLVNAKIWKHRQASLHRQEPSFLNWRTLYELHVVSSIEVI